MYRAILFDDFMNGRHGRYGRFPDPTQVLKQNQNKQDIRTRDDATTYSLGFSMHHSRILGPCFCTFGLPQHPNTILEVVSMDRSRARDPTPKQPNVQSQIRQKTNENFFSPFLCIPKGTTSKGGHYIHEKA